MSNRFFKFQTQVEQANERCIQGEISPEERDNIVRGMSLVDETWGDIWMLSPKGEWFRKAYGSKQWVSGYPPALVDMTSVDSLSRMDIHQVACTIGDCRQCGLHVERNRAVPGEGPMPADVMMIGEGPGANEDKQARPFVGASGRLLEELLGNIGYKRADVFITNVVKCRPPKNRDPKPDELQACKDYLERQIELIDPKVIVTLGRFSMHRYFPGAAITKIHGQAKQIGKRMVIPMFHPAAALRNPKWRAMIIDDFNNIPALVEQAHTAQ
ncbi:uracil-DNA glycosylase [Anaerolineales bacterium HSG6]|nr:uracil-DNA glycosylase [Anaerolineales bacterium HSG6]